MEANRTCTLPEITSGPLKIKCNTLILILLPRLYLFTSLTTPKWNYVLVCTAWTHWEMQRLVWKAMRRVRLYSADFVICSNPQRVQNKRHSVFMLYMPATYPYQTFLNIAERKNRNRKINLTLLLTLRSSRWFQKVLEQRVHNLKRVKQSGDQIETPWRQTEVRIQAVAYYTFFYLLEAYFSVFEWEGLLLGILKMQIRTLSLSVSA